MTKTKSNEQEVPKDEFKYFISPKLKKKLDILIDNLKRNDSWVIIDGDEGSGKTNTAAYILWYVHCMTGREFNRDASQFYFDSDAMFEYVKDHDRSLVNWDEAALGGLSTEWWNKSQRNLIKFAMTGRKKHHFFVLCIPKIFKLTEYLKVDRSHALIHMDLGRHRNNYGNAMYITRRGKSALCKLYSKNKYMAYGKCMRKYGGFGFSVPYIFEEVLDEKAYDDKKDKAISEIGQKKITKHDLNKEMKYIERGKKIYELTKAGLTLQFLADHFGVTPTAIKKWASGGNTPELQSPLNLTAD